MPLPSQLPQWAARALTGGLIGAGVSEIENRTLLSDADPKLKHVNDVLGAVTGGIAGQGGKATLAALAAWPAKQMALLGVNTGKKYVDLQIPKAKIDLEAANAGREAATAARDAANLNHESSQMQLNGLKGLRTAALLGGGGYLVYKAIQALRERNAANEKAKRPVSAKPKGGANKLRIDIPANKLSPEFLESLAHDLHADAPIKGESAVLQYPKSSSVTTQDRVDMIQHLLSRVV